MIKIGLECHVQLTTQSKLFCGCSTTFTSEPNTNVCDVCLGMPGSKPRINKKAVEYGILVATALNCEIPRDTFFSRKSYFYPDMSKNFQITQYEIPLASNGYLNIEVKGKTKKIRIRRINLEEDPARIQHVGESITAARYILIDYNRSGVPLCEIVTDPDFETPEETRIFLEKLSQILEYLGVFDSSIEGSMRVDSNVSIEGGERVEIKNISGFKDIERALNFEIIRQKRDMQTKGRVEMETRAYDDKRKITVSLRKKEEEEDYGYIFETDLPRVEITRGWINKLRRQIPELPNKRIDRLVKKYGITKRDATIVCLEKDYADFFERVCKKVDARLAAVWFTGIFKKTLNYNNLRIKDTKLQPEHIIELLKLVKTEKITERSGEMLLREMVLKPEYPKKLVEVRGVKRIKEVKTLETLVDEVLTEESKAVLDLKAGRREALDRLVGAVMKKSGGRADPKKVRHLIEKKM